MLSYQHEYHAGNHADVLKHAVWTLVIRALQRKPGALRLYDAHAGSGLYDLGSREARLNAEHAVGIGRLAGAASPIAELAPYLEQVAAANAGAALRRYPGSPLLGSELLREHDHLVALELHPRAFGALRRLLGRKRRVHLHQRDCYEGLPALLPPPERRGAVLIDPSYEVKKEFAQVAELVAACHARWPSGTYVIWYPFIPDRAVERFPARVAATGIRRIYRLALQVADDRSPGLRGSGVLIVNPPFGLTDTFESMLPALWRKLAPDGAGHAHAGWLVGE
jgi:23S rRNA (adenine2030-N6)-methyltransferase